MLRYTLQEFLYRKTSAWLCAFVQYTHGHGGKQKSAQPATTTRLCRDGLIDNGVDGALVYLFVHVRARAGCCRWESAPMLSSVGTGLAKVLPLRIRLPMWTSF